jgi:hypothetical protein
VYFVQFGGGFSNSPYRDKKVVGVFVRFRAPLHASAKRFELTVMEAIT